MSLDPLSLSDGSVKESLFGDDDSAFADRHKDMFGLFSSNPAAPHSSSSSVVDKRLSTSRLSVKPRAKVTSETEDPLSQAMLNSYDPVLRVTKENLTIRKDDEARIVAGLHSAAKKQTTGSIYSVVVDLGKTGTLGIGVKDLADKVLAVSMLKRANCCPGAGEDAGIRLGDVIFGVNFIPTREGSKTLISIIKKESQRGKSHVHIQGWRCHQLCSDAIPGYHFPRADEILVQAYSLVQSKVFSDWERWNFIEILLGHMLEDLKMRTSSEGLIVEDPSGLLMSPHTAHRAKQMQVLDLERNILQAKGLRTALCVRIVHTKSFGDTVVYVLRVEDVESGLQWVVQRRYSDFFALNEELLDMTHFTKEVEFPRKRLSIRNTAKLVENRIVALEQYMRRMLHILTLYATMDSSASSTLRHLQTFLGVDNYLDCVHPPPLDDQRFIELMAYQFLNDFGSEACQQCVRFITTVDLDSVVEIGAEGYVPVLNYVRDALSEVEQFVQQQHMSQMVQTLHSRRPDLNEDQQRSFVRKCIRRQVEAALYLPLRRTVFRIVFSFLAGKSKHLQRAITLLQRASPKFLMVDPFVTRAPALPRTVKAFRRVIQAYLPADQGQLLIHAATSVMELHKECQAERNRLAHVLSSIPENGSADLTPTDDIEIPLPRRLSDEVDMQYVSTKTPDLDIGLLVPPPVVPESRGDGDMDLPATPKRPVVTKLRELFSRKKTSEDLFNSSGSDDDEASVSSNSVFGAGGTTPTNSYITGLNSAPNSPMRPAAGTSLFKRLIPRVTSGARNTDTADNLFVDEKKAFTVSVKSDMSNQDSGSAGSSSPSTPRPCNTASNGAAASLSASNHSSIDDDLQCIQKHTASLRIASTDLSLDPGTSHSSTTNSPKAGIAEISTSVERFSDLSVPAAQPTTTEELTISTDLSQTTKGGAVSATAEAVTPLMHDEHLLQNLLKQRPQSLELTDYTNRDWVEPSGRSLSSNSAPTTPINNNRLAHTVSATPGTYSAALLEAMASNHTTLRDSLSELHAVADLKSIAAAAASAAAASSSSAKAQGDQQTAVRSVSREHEVNLLAGGGEMEGAGEEDALNSNMRDDSMVINNTTEEGSVKYDAISADDFLPLFTYVLIQAGLPQLLLVKELMTALVNDEDSYGECGYYLATLEAATQHIFDLADQYEAQQEGAGSSTNSNSNINSSGAGGGGGGGLNGGNSNEGPIVDVFEDFES